MYVTIIVLFGWPFISWNKSKVKEWIFSEFFKPFTIWQKGGARVSLVTHTGAMLSVLVNHVSTTDWPGKKSGKTNH